MTNFWTYPVSNWQLRIATRPDNESEKMTNVLRHDRRIMSIARLRATSSAVKMLAWLVIRKLLTISPLTAAAAVPLFVFDPSVYIWQKPCRSSQISRNLLLKTTAFVSDFAKLFKDKSTNGRLNSQCGTVEIDEVKISFRLKPTADKNVLTRRPRGRIWFGRLSKSFENCSSKGLW